MNDILLSIKPRYIEQILSGEKKYEFRRNIPKQAIGKIYIYASSPVKRIVGIINCDDILEDELNNLWSICKEGGCISKEDFFRYFEGKKVGYAYSVKSFEEFKEYKKLQEFGIKNAPQSFMYIPKFLKSIEL